MVIDEHTALADKAATEAKRETVRKARMARAKPYEAFVAEWSKVARLQRS
ncbi:hypothetical protein NBRC116599_22830 [Aquicoccus sp. SU-CL01552]